MDVVQNKQEVTFEGSSSVTATANSTEYIPNDVYMNLPEPLKEITEQFQGRERDIILLSSLGVISGCMPNVFGIYANQRYYPNLYIFVIAPPASGKGSMNWAKKLVEPIHEEIVGESKRKISEYRNIANNENIPEPKLEIKLVPGNTSSSKFYTHLERAEDALIIFESEADTLSNMLKQDWGNFSDLLRKGFHHETLSISRSTEDRFFEIKDPKLSIIVSGTPNQVKPLVDSKENGLFSRFIYYYFDEISSWKDVSPNAYRVSYDDLMAEKAIVVKELSDKLKSLKKVEIKLTREQWNFFQMKMSKINDLIVKTEKVDFLSIVRRLGIAFRLICILTVLEKNLEIEDEESVLVASDIHVEITFKLVNVLLEHSLKVFDKFDNKGVALNMQERELISLLPNEFKRGEGLEISNSIGIPERTYDEILKKWNAMKIIQKVSHGNYKKIIFNN